MTWSWHLSLLEKFTVNMQCAIMKYKIIRKAMVLGRVEVNSLKFAEFTRSRIWRRSHTYLINSKKASKKVCEIWLKLRLLKDMETF